MKRNKSMKMGRSMKRSGGQMMPGQDPQVQQNGMQPGQVQPGQVQPGQVQPPVNTGSWMPDFLSSSGDQAKGLLTDLSGETKTLTGDAGNYLKGFMPGSSAGSDTQVVPVAVNGEEEKKGIFSSFGFSGGRRRHKSRQLRGGLNQSFGYNAAPIMDSVTAEPTYMIKGGRRRRRSSRKRSCKKRRGCKKSCKRHRHRR
jgi:hypothetical protein